MECGKIVNRRTVALDPRFIPEVDGHSGFTGKKQAKTGEENRKKGICFLAIRALVSEGGSGRRSDHFRVALPIGHGENAKAHDQERSWMFLFVLG